MKRYSSMTAALALMLAGALALTGCDNGSTSGGGNPPPETVATPTASPAQAISLATTTGGAVIHYTTDGSAPSASSTAYTTPFTLPSLPATVKAIAVKAGWNDSAVLTAAYTEAAGNPAQEAADAFKTDHTAILEKTVGNVAVSDEAAVDAALAAHGLLSADAKALLTAEKTLLDNLKAKINELKATPADPTGESTVTVNLWTDDDTIFATADSVTLSRGASPSETALITLSGDGYTGQQWSINGIDVAAPDGIASTFTFASAGRYNGQYNIGLQVQKNGSAWYSTTITITVEN
ncbi:hypothetical protein AGMMS49940_23130 [Spirochaetia bacterium]|nr:hypothetical protein AGMMS49940_23130 [Spirochaetia bacterium]